MHKIYKTEIHNLKRQHIKCKLLPQLSVKTSRSSLQMFLLKSDNVGEILYNIKTLIFTH